MNFSLARVVHGRTPTHPEHGMATKLDKALKREITINDVTYMVTFSPDGLKIVEKGKRKGSELTWEQLIRGDITLANDLKDSVELTME
jgi:hypothetical protein